MKEIVLAITATTLDAVIDPPSFPANPEVDAIILLALAEDVGRGDITTAATVPMCAAARAEILQKGPGVRVCLTRLADEGSYSRERRTVTRIDAQLPRS